MIKTECLTLEFKKIKGWKHSLNDFNSGEHLMNFNIIFHFANFEEND